MPKTSKDRAKKAGGKLMPRHQAMLNGNPKRSKQIDKFIDKDHKVSSRFYDLTEGYQPKAPSPEKVISDMQKLIDADSDFLDPYSYIAEAYYRKEDYEKYHHYVFDAYLEALP